jgi:histidyl-tRNA synthetase
MRVQNYIFDTWKRVCQSFGFEEYDFPIIEPLEIFAAKSGQELVSEQIFAFEDKGGRKLAVRPELTPGTVRLIAQKYKELPQPIKWFMIGNNWRFEKPQLGRGREFNQLEANIFGIKGVEADFEIFSLITAIMTAFGATPQMYDIKVSDRRLIAELLTDQLNLEPDAQTAVRRLMDKRAKMAKEEFFQALQELKLTSDQAEKVESFMTGTLETLSISATNEGLIGIKKLFAMLKASGLDKNVKFDPSIIRGFDYSDGLVYEVFDKNPENRRSIYGGERFYRLINIFGDYELPSTGFAMGDYTLAEFLKGWNLLPQMGSTLDYFITLWPNTSDKFLNKSVELATLIRSKGKSVFLWTTNDRLEKQLKYAAGKGSKTAVIIGENELETGSVTIKNMETGAQETITQSAFVERL